MKERCLPASMRAFSSTVSLFWFSKRMPVLIIAARLLLWAKLWNCRNNTCGGVLFLCIYFGAADTAEHEFPRSGINEIDYE